MYTNEKRKRFLSCGEAIFQRSLMVPEKLEGIAWMREIRDITQILMNTAVVAATVIKLW